VHCRLSAVSPASYLPCWVATLLPAACPSQQAAFGCSAGARLGCAAVSRGRVLWLCCGDACPVWATVASIAAPFAPDSLYTRAHHMFIAWLFILCHAEPACSAPALMPCWSMTMQQTSHVSCCREGHAAMPPRADALGQAVTVAGMELRAHPRRL